MEEKREKTIQIIVGTVLFILAVVIDKLTDFNNIINFIIYLFPYMVASYDSFKEAIEELKEKEYFSENILMIVASLGALLIGFLPSTEAQFAEGIFVMLFFQVGELFEIIAEGKTERSIESLLELRPEYANKVEGTSIKKVDPSSIKVGDFIVVNPGEKVPLDGNIVEGDSYFNTALVTGESVPKSGKVGDLIYSGYINKSGVIKLEVINSYQDSTINRIIELVKNAQEKKSNNEKFITKFAKYYTPIVMVLALIVAIVPSLIVGDTVEWIKRALTFLVVSCPCALVVSVPLAYFGGIGGASKKGILFKGSSYLESISKVDTIVMDKTGTITEGVFEVVAVHPKEMSEDELLHITYHVEEYSNHPIALSLKEFYHSEKRKKCDCKISNIKELVGLGMKAKVNNEEIYIGNTKLMDEINIEYEKCDVIGTIIHIASKKEYYGHIVIADKIKNSSINAIKWFNEKGIDTVMLTGDVYDQANNVAKKTGINKLYAELLPEDKVKKIEDINTDNLLFVGDGINDAPVIARSNIGVAMGGVGSDIAIDAADVVLIQDNLYSLVDAIEISEKTNLIAKENIYFSIGIKILVLVLSFFGITNMWMAVFADVGVTVLAILNSIRTLK